MITRLRRKNLHNWLPGYGRWLVERALRRECRGKRHLLFALCDHYEPLWGGASTETGLDRVRFWARRYPELAAGFVDADGRPPRHSFFFPGEQYAAPLLQPLAELTRAGLGEVEVHLHHDGATAAELRRDLAVYLTALGDHGLLSRTVDGGLRFAFIHGNWALANARRDRRWCGVDEELPLLFAAGCYADFTFPAAPDECQPRIVNRIYWPEGDLRRARAYEQGAPARVGERRHDRLLLIQGPLALARRPGSWRPRIESGALTAVDPATPSRVRTWVEQGIGVVGRPEWVFVKVYTHGAPEAQAASLLGDGGRALHEALRQWNDGRSWALHYVTAREMYNLACAAMDGHSGDPDAYRDYLLPPPPVCR